MALNKNTFVKAVSPLLGELGFIYLKNLADCVPVVFGKRVFKDLYLFLLFGRESFGMNDISIEMALSPSTNAILSGRDIPSNNIRRLNDLLDTGRESFPSKESNEFVWSFDMLSCTSVFTKSVTIAESCMLGDTEMIEGLKRSRLLILETQLEKWVISFYHSKEITQLPYLEFLRHTPHDPLGGIPIKWFIVAEVILYLITWDRRGKNQVYSLAIQSYWKDYLDFADENP